MQIQGRLLHAAGMITLNHNYIQTKTNEIQFEYDCAPGLPCMQHATVDPELILF